MVRDHFCKNDLIPTQLHTTLHLMAFIFLISYFQSHILGNIYVLYFCESMPWRGRMGPTQNLFWNYMLFKMRDFLRKITKHDILGKKKGGSP